MAEGRVNFQIKTSEQFLALLITLIVFFKNLTKIKIL